MFSVESSSTQCKKSTQRSFFFLFFFFYTAFRCTGNSAGRRSQPSGAAQGISIAPLAFPQISAQPILFDAGLLTSCGCFHGEDKEIDFGAFSDLSLPFRIFLSFRHLRTHGATAFARRPRSALPGFLAVNDSRVHPGKCDAPLRV